MPKSFKEWIQEGEELYSAAMNEYQAMEAQLEELETRLAAKVEEVNQIASMIGKPPVEPARRAPQVQIVEKRPWLYSRLTQHHRKGPDRTGIGVMKDLIVRSW